jgi:orotate phosphoribosyltransferase
MMSINSILSINDFRRVQRLTRAAFQDRRMTNPEFRHIFKLCDALWLHSGNASHPHAELTTGKCSNGFANVLQAIKHTNLCEIFAAELIKVLRDHTEFNELNCSDWVIGSDHAGATLSFEVARQLGIQHDFTEKNPTPENKKRQVWKRFPIQPGEQVLQVEELITTTRTLCEVREGLRRGNKDTVEFTPYSATLVHRSPTYKFEGSPIFYVAHFDIDVWDPAECPLCKAGSKPIKPKDNWTELIANNGA